MNFTADREEFAAAQGEVQKKDESYLVGSARVALRNVGKRGWYTALLRRVEQVARTAYRRESGHISSDALRARLTRMRAELVESLDKTTKPEKSQIESRALSLAKSLSSLANAVGVEAASHDDPDEIGLEWVTMHDDRVRTAHAAADGQVRLPGEKYDVGGVEMSRPGDVTAPIELWINCRCALRPVRTQPDSVAAAATQYEEEGQGIFLLPAADDPIHDLTSEKDAHVTTIFLGLSSENTIDQQALAEAVALVADDFDGVDVEVKGRDSLGEDEADVAFLNRDQLLDLREALLSNETIAAAMEGVEQFPDWLPHLTLGYPDAPAPEGELPSTIRLDRLALWVGTDHTEYPLGGDMSNTEIEDREEVNDAVEDDDIEDISEVDDVEVVYWHGALAPEGVKTGDGRKFGVGSMRWRDLPLPLAWQKTNMGGHDGSVVTGRIDNIWRDENNILQAEGVFLATSEADEHINLIAEGAAPGVSVDVDDATMSFEDGEGNPVTFDDELDPEAQIVSVITSGRICGATGCAIPAFAEAYIALGPHPNPPQVERDIDNDDSVDLVATCGKTTFSDLDKKDVETYFGRDAAFVKTEDGPGWLTHPVDTERLRRYWTRGKGAAKIRWGVPGDFNRCRAQLAKYIKPQHLSGYCANRHYDALGFWPGRPVSADTVEYGGTPFSLVASADVAVVASNRFANPGLTEPTRLTITEDGHVYGHLAQWGTCHIGITNVCTTPPESLSDYIYFATGMIESDAGPMPVGTLTMSCGHAGPNASAKVAAAHYDDIGTAFAYVAMGEDDIGIWFSGVLADGITEEQIKAVRAAGSVSGDWRKIGQGLELVAALIVNVPGFPITPTQIAASGGEQTALIASGIVVESANRKTLGEIVGNAVAEHFAGIERRKRMADLKAATGRDNRSRLDKIKAERETV